MLARTRALGRERRARLGALGGGRGAVLRPCTLPGRRAPGCPPRALRRLGVAAGRGAQDAVLRRRVPGECPHLAPGAPSSSRCAGTLPPPPVLAYKARAPAPMFPGNTWGGGPRTPLGCLLDRGRLRDANLGPRPGAPQVRTWRAATSRLLCTEQVFQRLPESFWRPR